MHSHLGMHAPCGSTKLVGVVACRWSWRPSCGAFACYYLLHGTSMEDR